MAFFLGVVAGLGVGFNAAVLYRDLGGEAGAGLTGSAMENVLVNIGGGCSIIVGAAIGAAAGLDLLTKLVSLFCGAAATAVGDTTDAGTGAGANAGIVEEATTDAAPESICFPTPANLAFRNCSPIVDIF